MMSRDEIGDWIQIIATIGVLAGLILVAVEIRQNSRLVHAELNAQQMFHLESVYGAFRNPEFAVVFQKSITQPESLTPAEELMIDGHYRTLISFLWLDLVLVDRQVFEDTNAYWADYAVRHGIGTVFGQKWWSQHKLGYSDRTERLIDESLERLKKGQVRMEY